MQELELIIKMRPEKTSTGQVYSCNYNMHVRISCAI